MSHVAEPWTMETHRLSLDAHRLAGCGSNTWLMSEYNYARACACVNACAGVADPDELRKQRDELLAACKGLLHEVACTPDVTDTLSVIDKAEATIARVEGGAS